MLFIDGNVPVFCLTGYLIRYPLIDDARRQICPTLEQNL